MSVRALFADIATTTGLAFDGEAAGAPRCVTFRATGAADGDFGEPYAKFFSFISDTLAVVKPDIVAFEAPLVMAGRHGSKVLTNQNTVRLLFGLAAIFELCARRAGIHCFESNVASIKKHFTGHGHADKSAIIARCRQLNWPVKNDHEADAAAGWDLLKSLRDPKWSPRSTPLFGLVKRA